MEKGFERGRGGTTYLHSQPQASHLRPDLQQGPSLRLREGLGEFRQGARLPHLERGLGRIHLERAPHSEQTVSPETGFTLRAHGRAPDEPQHPQTSVSAFSI